MYTFSNEDSNDLLKWNWHISADYTLYNVYSEDLYNKKLWHQLTVQLKEVVKHQSMQEGDNIIQLFNKFITDFESR